MDIGKRVEDCTRVGDIIGRAGGNQFGLILPEAGEAELRTVADQVLSTARQREVNTEAGPLSVSLSLGGTLLPKDANSSREVTGRTEEALSKAKQRGRDRFVLHRASANRDATRRKSLATGDAVMRAMKDGRLTFAVQPIINSVTGETELYECLLRMLNEKGEMIPRFSNKLRDLGCRIALDDFGAGYTSYQHLKALAVDIVKIDGQFVQTLLDLAHGFNAEVVSECVETEAKTQALRDLGVKYLQGYHFGAPTLARPWDAAGLEIVPAR